MRPSFLDHRSLSLSALVLLGIAGSTAHADPMFRAVNLIQGAVYDLNDSGQLIASWGTYPPTIYDGYGGWANKTRPPVAGPFGPAYYSSGNMVLNDAGQVAVDAGGFPTPDPAGRPNSGATAWHATISDGRSATDLGTLGGTNSTVRGINEFGQVSGDSDLPDGTRYAFLYDGGKMTDLGSLPGGKNSYAQGINDSGQVVGFANTGPTGTPRFSNGREVAFPDASLSMGGVEHAVLYDHGKAIDLGTLGGESSAARAINNAGVIVGTSELPGGEQHAFVYADGKMTDLGILGTDWKNTFWNLPYSQAHDINNAGQIVGQSNSRAFLFEDGKMLDLNTLVDLPGITLTSAWDINNAGQILATGTDDMVNRKHVYDFLLSPSDLAVPEYAIPEPSTLAVLVLGSVILVGRHVRERRV
jgi:probable HAF family extracellular repeat protein